MAAATAGGAARRLVGGQPRPELNDDECQINERTVARDKQQMTLAIALVVVLVVVVVFVVVVSEFLAATLARHGSRRPLGPFA